MHELPKFSQALQVKLSQILAYKALLVTTSNTSSRFAPQEAILRGINHMGISPNEY
ncbi:hypothetical protein H6G81_13700 [Scytonema hofmannii FACHB-248]|uniref:Uncharacterized protein n=1 Tax=Scytonema hofmannii FACHB-248 TaxID=1842502 RepID=A0ABR8GQR3_9CYAN|nr:MULTISPECIES: hypothetical protein [Nostocales]MBD2605557.1 hypothetical protein [Scytonema hofmannii FACHB-248]